MKSVLIAVVAALTVYIFLGGSDDDAQSPVTPTESGRSVKAPGSDLVEPVASDAAVNPLVVVPDRVEVEVSDPRGAAAPECVVLGRIVDDAGAALGGVYVSLAGYKDWNGEEGAGWLEGSSKYKGFDMRTNVAGEFRFEVPVPTNTRTYLKLKPDTFHDSHSVTFDSNRNQSEPTLTAGVRDMGEIVLGTTGAIRGRVVDQQGQPLVDVTMGTGPGAGTTYGRGATTSLDGTYYVEHARVGSYAVKAKLEGYLSGYLEPVTVEAELETQGVDFVLLPAPTLAGVVLDENRVPIEGVSVVGWPLASGMSARATSDSEGRFVLHLPQDEEYSLEASHPDFSKLERGDLKEVSFTPGASDIEILLDSRALATVSFLVVDGETKQPIARFGLRIDVGLPEGKLKSLPAIEAHAKGRVTAIARKGEDSVVVVAEGYLDHRGAVFAGKAEGMQQTVYMERGRKVVGRVVRDGRAEPGALVEIGGPSGGLSTTTDEEGHFRFDDIMRGLYRIEVKPRKGAPLVLRDMLVMELGINDLGELVLVEGARVEGSVLLPPGIEPEGLSVVTGDWRSDVKASLDSEGRFVLGDLKPGTITVYLAGIPGVLTGGAEATLDLVSGQTGTVTLDARDDAMCAVDLTLDLGGLPLGGARVVLRRTGKSREETWIGTCDQTGHVAGSARAWGLAKVGVRLAGTGTVEHPDLRLELLPGSTVQARVQFDFAELLVKPRGKVALPERGKVTLLFDRVDGLGETQKYVLGFKDGRVTNRGSIAQGVMDDSMYFKTLLPGVYKLNVEFKGQQPGEAPRLSPDGLKRLPDVAYFDKDYEIELVKGAPLELEL